MPLAWLGVWLRCGAASVREWLGCFSPEAAYLVSDILSDHESRSRTFHLESLLAARFWSAVKTGTSNDMRDNWCVGYSTRYTVGVWAGNFSGEPMWNVSGIARAAPVWIEVMNYLHRDASPALPDPLPGLALRPVEFAATGQMRRDRIPTPDSYFG